MSQNHEHPNSCWGILAIDRNWRDYRALIETTPQECHWHLFRSANTAIRFLAERPPGAHGVDLCFINRNAGDRHTLSLLRQLLPKAKLVAVDDAYDPAVEQAARQLGVTAYLCKPATRDWLILPLFTPMHRLPRTAQWDAVKLSQSIADEKPGTNEGHPLHEMHERPPPGM